MWVLLTFIGSLVTRRGDARANKTKTINVTFEAWPLLDRIKMKNLHSTWKSRKSHAKDKTCHFPIIDFWGPGGGYFVQDLLGVQKFRWFSNTISFSLSANFDNQHLYSLKTFDAFFDAHRCPLLRIFILFPWNFQTGESGEKKLWKGGIGALHASTRIQWDSASPLLPSRGVQSLLGKLFLFTPKV